MKKYGDTTATFIEFLKTHGPQTIQELKEQPFWNGIRSRIPKLVDRGLVEKIMVPNYSGERWARPLTPAYQAVEGAVYKPCRRASNPVETYRERVAREAKERATVRAVQLLEQQGYVVFGPNGKAHG